MNRKSISQSNDPLLKGSAAALRRAAVRAKQRAQQTGTRLVVSKDHVVTWLDVATPPPPKRAPRRRPGV